MVNRLLFLISFLVVFISARSQYPPYPAGVDTVIINVNVTQFDSLFLSPNINCANAIEISGNQTFPYQNEIEHYTQTDSVFTVTQDPAIYPPISYPPVTDYDIDRYCGVEDLWFKMKFNDDDTLDIVSGSYSGLYMYGPCNGSGCCTDINLGYIPSISIYSSQVTIDDLNNQEGWYYLKIEQSDNCSGEFIFDYSSPDYDTTYNSDSTYTIESNEGCENCITSFNPKPGEKYVITAWTKEDGAAATKTSYDKPEIYMEYPSVSVTQGAFKPSGEIIDGWQRIEGVFTIPANALDFKIILTSTSGDVYFDDVKVHPFDSSMKSFVYDPVTKRLKATFDERHYATFYEYDKEGKLTRVKKETEKGIMTIKESRNNNSK